MPFPTRFFRTLISFIVCIILLSCEEEGVADPVETLQSLPIQVVTNTSTSGTGDLTVVQGNGIFRQLSAIPYNEVQEIELDINSEGTYLFQMEDTTHGRLKIYVSQEELQHFTLDNPLILQFGHYKNQKVAEFNIRSE
ncbi:MAG: hypothetical protein AAF969_12220, partial [Bacteroidota bacterium]